MGMQNTPDIETIRAAVAGEAWALEKVLACYDDEINRLATVKERQSDGSMKVVVDEDMRASRRSFAINGNADLWKRYRREAGVSFPQVPQEGVALL